MGNQQESTSEVYKQHREYGKLEISNYGNVRNSKSKKPRYTSVNKQGYPTVQIKRGGKVKTLKIHRLVAELFLPPPSEELIEKCSKEHWGVVLVKHLDNNKCNNHVSNLEWCDLKSNTKQAWDDSLITGLRGSENGRATLSEESVHELCKFFEAGGTPKDAARIYNCSRQQASKIRAGIAWKHISAQYNIRPLRPKGKSSTTIESTSDDGSE